MWKLQVLLYSFLIPKEFSIAVGSLVLSPYRLILILFTPWVIKHLILKRKFRWQAIDTTAAFICIWPAVAISLNTDFFSGIESGGILFLETFIPFFLARLTIYNHKTSASIGRTLLIVASIMAAMAIPEAITGKPFIHNIASVFTGNSFVYSPENRLGIWRSYGPTDHPIILGSICAAALPIGFALFRRKMIFAGMTGLSFLGVIASASSGPVLAIVAQSSLYIWSVLTRGKNHKWWMLIILICLVYFLIDIASNRDPLRVMFSYLLFNEHNGYVRYNMWSNSFFLAGQSFESLSIGYGFSTEMMSLLDNPFWSRLMTSSVDSYWLVILLRYGFPMLVIHALMVVFILRANIKTYRACKLKKERNLIFAWFITLISLSLVACTVHFWGSTASLFFIVLGASAMRKKTERKDINQKSHLGSKAQMLKNQRSAFPMTTQNK